MGRYAFTVFAVLVLWMAGDRAILAQLPGLPCQHCPNSLLEDWVRATEELEKAGQLLDTTNAQIRANRSECEEAEKKHQDVVADTTEVHDPISAEAKAAMLLKLSKAVEDCRTRGENLEAQRREAESSVAYFTKMKADIEKACNKCNPSTASPLPPVDFFNPAAWGSAMTVGVNGQVQVKFADGIDSTQYPEIAPINEPIADARRWFNPLGLLTRHVRDQVDRWRGSMGPRPLLRPRDLELIEEYSSGEQLGLPKGVHVLLTDRGGSTGRTMSLQILNLSGRPVVLRSVPFAVEPIAQQAQQRVQQAFGRLAKAAPVNVDLFAYCVEFLKAPPSPNQIFRLAPKAVQDKFAPMSKVLQSAARIQKEGLLSPDSNPAAYTDAIKQWAVWTVEQNLNESRFTAAFLGHSRKNVESAGRQWPRDGDAMIRKASPNRWRDIVQVLRGAGVPVPQ